MRCLSSVVELLGWTATYAVGFSDPTHPKVAVHPRPAGPPPSPYPGNLGHGRAEIIDLEANGAEPGEFQLVISRASRRVDGGLEHYTVSELIRRTRAPAHSRILNSSTLLVDVSLETIH
jgi:hypothetical protein